MNSNLSGKRNWIGPFALGVAATLPLSVLAIFLAIQRERIEMSRSTRTGQMHPASEMYEGPGGRIEALRIPLANPGGKLPDEAQRLKPVTWFFEGYSEERLDQWVRSLHAPPLHVEALLDRRRWSVTSNGCVITPTPRLIWTLPPGIRQRIYSVLAESEENYPQRIPFRFTPGRFGPSLNASGLSASRIQQLEQLTYTNGDTVCFADLRAAKDTLTDSEFEDLVENFYLTPTYRLRLRVAPDANLEELIAYWGKHGRAELIRPILKGLTRVPNGASISLPFLLPPYARIHLYTYPESWQDATVGRQDCVYAALNFFNETPNTNFFDRAYVEQALASQYVRLQNEQPQFGDIVMLLDSNNQPLHFCVYVVADFVFTKNGINGAQPWVFMNMQDVLLTYYGPDAPRRVTILRRIETNGQPSSVMARLNE